MPQHATTVTEYCAAVARSRLIPEADVRDLHHRWKAEGKGSDADVDLFRKFLVAKRCLTEYQAALIQRGRPDGFFVGGYVILDRLGKGASAGVYKAVHTSGQVVALKVLARSRAKDPHVLNRFRREGRLLTQFDHPNVVRAFQVGQSGPVHFIVMEYLEGETLDEVIGRRKRLPAGESVRLVHQALQGLQHLHEKRMVHRDLKPANLMVAPPAPPGGPDDTLTATLKILDVGIGRELFDEVPVKGDNPLTTEGAILGTPDYLAPEQARDARSADIRADIYGAGCVLYHLIAGRPPFGGSTVMAQMVKHATETPPPLTETAPGVPAGLQAVFEKLTAKDPNDRYPAPWVAAEALAPFLPAGAAAASKSGLLPAYREFLETESALEMPAELRKPSGSTTLRIPNLADQPPAPAQPTSRPIPVAPPRPAPPPTAAPADDEIDVELLSFTPPPAGARRDARAGSGFDLTRRDFVMLGAGAAGVLLAIGAGYGLAKVLKKATDEPPKGDEKGGP